MRPMIPGRVLAIALLLAPGALAVGCSDIRRIEECNVLVNKINDGSGVLKEFDRAKDIDEQVAKIESFERAVAGVELTFPELKQFADEYEKWLKDVAVYARDHADSTKYEELYRRSEELSKREKDFVDRLNTYCRSG